MFIFHNCQVFLLYFSLRLVFWIAAPRGGKARVYFSRILVSDGTVFPPGAGLKRSNISAVSWMSFSPPRFQSQL